MPSKSAVVHSVRVFISAAWFGAAPRLSERTLGFARASLTRACRRGLSRLRERRIARGLGARGCRWLRGLEACDECVDEIGRQLGAYGHAPDIRPREREALDRILLGHDHGQRVAKSEIACDERVMIRKRMRNHVDAARLQPGKKTRGIAD